MDKGIEAPVIAVWFSCGAASAVAAKLTLERYGQTHTVRILNNPVAEEDDDNQRFLKDVEQWLGVKIETVINPMFPSCSAVDVWEHQRYMSGIAGAPCTKALKKLARKYWEQGNRSDKIVLGFTSEESHRVENFRKNERHDLIPVLVDAGLTKSDCFNILLNAGITLPRIYHLGYPNANCIGCVKATSPAYWNHVRKVHPDVFTQRAEQSRKFGVRLVRHKGVRMFLDELPEDAVGRPMKNMDFECGIFCAPSSEKDEAEASNDQFTLSSGEVHAMDNGLETLVRYATKRIVELESLLLVDVQETVWPAEVGMVYTQIDSAKILPVHHQRRLKHHINRMWLEQIPVPSIITAARSLANAMEKYA